MLSVRKAPGGRPGIGDTRRSSLGDDWPLPLEPHEDLIDMPIAACWQTNAKASPPWADMPVGTNALAADRCVRNSNQGGAFGTDLAADFRQAALGDDGDVPDAAGTVKPTE